MHAAVDEPLAATALVLDIRGFTREMSATLADDVGRSDFLRLLADMNAIVVEASIRALHPKLRDEPAAHVYLGSTGDGAIAVFLHPVHHAVHGMLAALLMRAAMHDLCESYTHRHGRELSFGIGVESGTVCRVGRPSGALSLSTYIGECINAATRTEVIMKDIHRTEVIFCGHVVEILSELLLGADYGSLMRGVEIPAGSISDAEYLEYERGIVEVNRQLCITYLHMHLLRGFSEPLALFRLSKSSAALDNPRFERVLSMLTGGDEAWLEEIRGAL